MKRLVSLGMLAMFLMANITLAQKTDVDNIVIGKTIKIKSKALGEVRTMRIFLPTGYDRSTDEYAVLYLLDGGYHFHHVSGMVSFLSRNGVIPQMIVVGIENIDRNRDFSPTNVETLPTSGGAAKFLDFLTDELIPYIDKTYRTMAYRILMGHSFGGTFATYTLLEKPETFDAYIAVSPYLSFDDQLLVKRTKKDLKSSFKKNIYFYMTQGNEPAYIAPLTEFSEFIKSEKPEGLELEYVIMESETHGSVPHLSIYYGLVSIFSEWLVPQDVFELGLTAIEDHYKKISEKYGINVSASEASINRLGYDRLGKGNVKEAIEIFKSNVKNYPASANVYDSLGEAYENDGQLELAAKNYETACKKGALINDPNLTIYLSNFERVDNELEKLR